MRVFAEKQELWDDIYRTLGRFLQFDQILNGICFGFDKTTIKSFSANQRKHAGFSFQQSLGNIIAFEGVGKASFADKVIDVRQHHFNETGNWLPEIDLIIKTDLRKRQVEFSIAAVIKQVFKITSKFGCINHNRVVFNLLQNCDLVFGGLDTGIK